MDTLDLSFLSNPEVIGINLLDEHSSHHFYVNGKEPIYSLNGKWDFYRSSGWVDELLDYKTLAFKNINLPISAEMVVPEDLIYTNIEYPWEGKEKVDVGEINLKRDPVNIFRKKFKLPKTFKGEKYLLRFEGFETAIYVYLNGHFVGYSTRLYVDSEFDLTPYLEKENEIVIYNFRYSASSWLLSQDFWKMSGIFRDISIIALPSIHLEDVDVKTDLVNDLKDGAITIKGKVTSSGAANIALCSGDKTYINEDVVIENNSFSLEKTIKNIKAWSAERPNLYWLTITCENKDGIQETSSLEIGFTHQEIHNGSLLFNGKKLLIKGVNRHEIHHLYGRHVPYEDLLFDFKLLKKNNFNAIRCCHYPDDKRFYELANRMGFYIMDECCIESHGTWNANLKDPSKWVPGDRPNWKMMALDRASSMYERDKNNPCIFSWSLGNESAGGSNIAAESDYFHSVDKKRVVHYEGEIHDSRLTPYIDIKSFMYRPADKLEEYLIDNPNKPVIECEYEHAMGNSCGNFDEYMRVFRKYPNCVGGFIWDYIDQGVLVDGKWRYGGDSNDVPNDLNFNCNGIIFSDRKEAYRSPKLAIAKKMYAPLQIQFNDGHAFLSLDSSFYKPSDFKLYLEDLVNGNVANKTKLVWNGEEEIELPTSSFENEHTRRIKVIHEGITDIFDEPTKFAYAPSKEESPMEFIPTNRYIGFRNDKVAFIFSKPGLSSGLVGIEKNGKEIISSQVRPTLYRPISDNDRGNFFALYSSIYSGFSKWNVPLEVKIEKSSVICTYFIGNIGAKAQVIYSLGEGPHLDVEIKYFGAKGMPSLPCFGLDIPLKKSFDKATFYGLGPLDTYPDSLDSGNLGVYSFNVDDAILPYSIPQECGHHSNVRYVKLDNGDATLLIEAMDKPFSFKFLPNDEFEIDNAKHLDELPKTRENHLTIYACMRGIGGDDSWGAKVHPQYELDGEKDYSIKFRLSVK